MKVVVGLIIFLFWVGIIFSMGFMWWRILRKTGYHGALGILMLIPGVNIIMTAILAFKDWPIHKDIKGCTVKSATSLHTSLVTIIVLVSCIPTLVLLVAIGIPNFFRAKINANEAIAEQITKKISEEIENYAIRNNGAYPVNEDQLKPYLVDSYDGKAIKGYQYDLSLRSDGYEISAMPERCYRTGIKEFKITTGGVAYRQDCKYRC